jgi:hypothetical protein
MHFETSMFLAVRVSDFGMVRVMLSGYPGEGEFSVWIYLFRWG